MKQMIGASINAAVEISAEHAAASASTPEEGERLRQGVYQVCEKGFAVAAVLGIGRGVKAVKGGAGRVVPQKVGLAQGAVPGGKSTARALGEAFEKRDVHQIKADYTSSGAPYSLRVDPITGKGPMHVDSRQFTSGALTKGGALRNQEQFWQLWDQKYPGTLSKQNLKYIGEGASPKVDSKWLSHFPEHQGSLGKKIEHHHIDHGHLAVPLPENVHRIGPGPLPGRTNYSVWHNY